MADDSGIHRTEVGGSVVDSTVSQARRDVVAD